MYRATKRVMIALAVMLFSVGIFGMVDGIRSVLAGGYADNIVLGAMVAFLFPLPPLWLCMFLRELEKERSWRL